MYDTLPNSDAAAQNVSASTEPQKHRAPPVGLVARMNSYARQVTGFQKHYNFWWFFVLGGALTSFVLMRLKFLNTDLFLEETHLTGSPYYQRHGLTRKAIVIHLASVLPAGLGACLQFLPVLRRKSIALHRINGRIVTVLLVLAAATGIFLAPTSFGGSVDIQMGVYTLGAMVLFASLKAWASIRRLQIDEHRTWMLRAWIWAGSIISLRIVMAVGIMVVSTLGEFYYAMPCKIVAFVSGSGRLAAYPSCSENGSGYAAVRANFFSPHMEEQGASAQMNFGMAIWVALVLHMLGLETYLQYTKHEEERLKKISTARQRQAGTDTDRQKLL